MRRPSLVASLALVLLSSCDCGLEPLAQIPDPPPPPPPGESTGSIAGRVCEPSGAVWFADAAVIVEPAGGERVESTTDADGRFRLDGVAPGQQLVHITKGAIDITRSALVPADATVTLPDDECGLDPGLRIAVVHGSEYDRVEGVLSELGVNLATLDVYQETWADELLGSDAGLDDYDILFLNCRSNESAFMSSAQMQARLRDFVAGGGSLYAADQAYDLIEVAFPDKINFFGADDVRGAADEGAVVDVNARVVDPILSDRLNASTVLLHFGLSTWSVMVGVANDVDIYVEADVPLLDGSQIDAAPMTVGFDHGLGRVVYSSFHEEPGIGEGQQQVLKLIMFEL